MFPDEVNVPAAINEDGASQRSSDSSCSSSENEDIPPPSFDEVERQERLEHAFRNASSTRINLEIIRGDSVVLEDYDDPEGHERGRYLSSEFQSFKKDPIFVTCQHCSAQVRTEVVKKFDGHWGSLCCSICICTLFCAWVIPCMYLAPINARYSNYQHVCPSCGLDLALYEMYKDPDWRRQIHN